MFNDLSLCLTALDSEKPVIAALGHSTDFSYFDLFGADVSFPVPATFGKFLKEVYEELVTEMELKKTHAELNSIINQKEMQIRSLETRIKELEKICKNLRESNYVLKILLIIALIVIVLLFFR